jgi:hypothetical protein
MHPSALKAQQTKRYLIDVDPLANQPGTVFVKGARREINNRILADAAFGWKEADPVFRINLRSLDHGQIVARYTKRGADGKPVVLSYYRYNATSKTI